MNLHVHVQLSLGQEKLERLKDAKDSKELEEAQAEIQRLQNELKVRMKLNQLQSSKVTTLAMVTEATITIGSGSLCVWVS